MKIQEQLWRSFQSRFAKLLNELPKDERREFYFVFGLKDEIESSFDFENIETLLKDRIKKSKMEKRRTKLLRSIFGMKEKKKQLNILTQTSSTFAKVLFENRTLVANKNSNVIRKAKLSMQKISLGCEFYPCENNN